MSSDDYIEKTSLPLHDRTQAYLRTILEREAPDTVLMESWNEFYRMYSNLIRRFVVAQGVRESDVDDCVQEVWNTVALKLVEFRHPVKHPGLRAWLYTVVRSKAMDLLRKKQRTAAESLSDIVEKGQEPSGREPDPASHFERDWEDAVLHTVLAELRPSISDTNYRLLRMRLLKGLDVATVASELDLKPDQVRYRQHRVLKKVKARLSVYIGENLINER